MSSDGSGSMSTLSKIRQFGLYRTVDSRTEEFLRLSRRRQIKQGCVCAAISTAITVTIVVVILLVYEYLTTSYSKSETRTNGKEYWQKLMNNTLNNEKFDEKFYLKRFGIDRKALNILPIFLKALKHNKFLEKLVNEQSITTRDNQYQGKQKTYYAESPNGISYPKENIYSFETLPIFLLGKFKTPNKRKADFSVAKKIKEQQRLVDYFNKMINKKYDSIKNNYKDAIREEDHYITFKSAEDNLKLIQDQTFETHENRIKPLINRTKHCNSTVCCKCPVYLRNFTNNIYKTLLSDKTLPSETRYKLLNITNNILKNNITNTTKSLKHTPINTFVAYKKPNITKKIYNKENVTEHNRNRQNIETTTYKKQIHTMPINKVYVNKSSIIVNNVIVTEATKRNKSEITERKLILNKGYSSIDSKNSSPVYIFEIPEDATTIKNRLSQKGEVKSNNLNSLIYNLTVSEIKSNNSKILTKNKNRDNNVTQIDSTVETKKINKNTIANAANKTRIKVETLPVQFEQTTIIYDFFYEDILNTTILLNRKTGDQLHSGIDKGDIISPEFSGILSDNQIEIDENYHNEMTMRTLRAILYRKPSYLNIERNEWWQEKHRAKTENEQ